MSHLHADEQHFNVINTEDCDLTHSGHAPIENASMRDLFTQQSHASRYGVDYICSMRSLFNFLKHLYNCKPFGGPPTLTLDPGPWTLGLES